MTAISSESKTVSAATPVAAARGKLAVDPKILRPALAPTNAAKAVKPASTPATPEDLDKLVQSIRNKVAAFAPELQFTIDAESGESVVRVTDAATKDVVWQFPSKLAFELAKEIDAFRKGMLLNQKA
jgi:flagellar protein FlaG